jgi:hypothetical protein
MSGERRYEYGKISLFPASDCVPTEAVRSRKTASASVVDKIWGPGLMARTFSV